jgi:hypothetical protein
MESKISKNKGAEIHKHFKKMGIGIIVLALLTGLTIKLLHIEMLPTQKAFFKAFTMNGFILGLLFVALAKEKIEDEMIAQMRLKAMSQTFITAVLYVIVRPFMDLVFRDPIQDVTGQFMVIFMLLGYLLNFHSQKFSNK